MGTMHRGFRMLCLLATVAACGPIDESGAPVASAPTVVTSATSVATDETDPTPPTTAAPLPGTSESASPTQAPIPVALPTGQWAISEIGPASSDVGVVFATWGDRTLLVVPLGDDGGPRRLSAIPITGDGPATPAEITVADRSLFNLAAAGGPNGWIVSATVYTDVANDPANFQPRVWTSPDGVAWAEGTFPAGPLDIGEIFWTGSSFVAVGVRRLNAADPSSGPFGAALFRSDDGQGWQEIALDPAVFGEPAPDDYFTDIVGLDGRLVAVKAAVAGDRGELRMYESADEGTTWRPVAAGGPIPERVFDVGGTLLGSSERGEQGMTFSRFADGSWVPLDADPGVVPAGAQAGFLVGGPGPLVAELGVETPIELCYDDPERCSLGWEQVPIIVAPGAVGAELHRLAIPDGLGEYSQIAGAGMLADGRFAIAWRTERGWQLSIWSGEGASLPIAPTPEPEVPNSGPPIIAWNDDIEPGVVYRFPMYVHCGMTWLQLDGRTWKTDAATPDDAMVNGLQQLLGEIELTSDDRLKFSLPDRGVIAVYTPTDDEPPGCA